MKHGIKNSIGLIKVKPKKQFILILLLLLVQHSFSQEKRELFRGGMFLHTGYVQSKTESPEINGMVSGIGGKITFRMGEHFRLGTEGYVSNFGYKENEGQYKLGWGGIITENQFNNNKLGIT